MEPKPEHVNRRTASDRARWLMVCLILASFLCGISGCVLTVWLYQVNTEEIYSLSGTSRLVNKIADALFYLVPLVTAVFVIAAFLTGLGIWFFYEQQQEGGQ